MKCLKVDEVARALALSEGQVRRLIAGRRLKALNVGTSGRNHWRIPEDALIEFTGSTTVKPEKVGGDRQRNVPRHGAPCE